MRYSQEKQAPKALYKHWNMRLKQADADEKLKETHRRARKLRKRIEAEREELARIRAKQDQEAHRTLDNEAKQYIDLPYT